MKNVIPRIFLDSNVLFSAFYGSNNCKRLIKSHQEAEIVIVVSQQVIEETTRNIQEKIPHALSSFGTLLTSNPPEVIVDPKVISSKIKMLIDSKDQPIFTSAILAKVDYFVTGNTKDFKMKELEKVTGIKILNPKQLVEKLDLK